MNNKLNIEELKFLVPDYITGQISDSDRAMLEKAMAESPELREFHNELKGTFDFVSTVKHEEPHPQYWQNLLPRIHQRIEENESKKLAGSSSLAWLWKVLIPAAAIILIAVIYYVVKPSNTQLTKDENKNIEKINKDSVKDEKKPNQQEIKQPETKQPETKQPEIKQDNIVKEHQRKPYAPEKKNIRIEDENIVKDEIQIDENNQITVPEQEDVASIDLNETSVFTAGEAGGFDEELENDLKELNDKEQNTLLKELENSNL